MEKLYQGGNFSAVSAGEELVPASELADALRQIRELQQLLGKKTVEVEILKAVEYGPPTKRVEVSIASRVQTQSGIIYLGVMSCPEARGQIHLKPGNEVATSSDSTRKKPSAAEGFDA